LTAVRAEVYTSDLHQREVSVALDPRLLEILVCPACAAPVRETDDHSAVGCTGCGRSFPIRDGIPSMLVDEASGPEEREPPG
jgi:uncharacterized protein YbaR (Trm112 family)